MIIGSRICRFFIWAWAALWLLAAFIAIVGIFGLFGVEPDGLAAVFVLALGTPWSWIITGMTQEPNLLIQIAIILSPGVTWLIIRWLCRRLR